MPEKSSVLLFREFYTCIPETIQLKYLLIKCPDGLDYLILLFLRQFRIHRKSDGSLGRLLRFRKIAGSALNEHNILADAGGSDNRWHFQSDVYSNIPVNYRVEARAGHTDYRYAHCQARYTGPECL